MWIKWKYIDHGHPDWSELEVPDNVVEEYGSVEEYLCEMNLVPHWSERFMSGRIKWKKIRKPKPSAVMLEIIKQEVEAGRIKRRIRRLKDLLSRLAK